MIGRALPSDVDLQHWAEDRAPTMEHSDWRDAESDAHASIDDAEHFDPTQARALMEHRRTVALDVLTTRQAHVLAECCESPPLRYDRETVLVLVELLAMRLIDGKTLEATDYGYEVDRVRDESGR